MSETLVNLEIEDGSGVVIEEVATGTQEIQELNNGDFFGISEAMGAAISGINHDTLGNLSKADQHPIATIIGLKDKLNDIDSIDTVYSDKNGVAIFPVNLAPGSYVITSINPYSQEQVSNNYISKKDSTTLTHGSTSTYIAPNTKYLVLILKLQ